MLCSRLTVGVLLALMPLGAWAKPAPRLVQSQVRAQIQVQDMTSISQGLDKLCQEHQAQIVHFNCDRNNSNGNFNVRVPEDKLGSFCAGLRTLGEVRSENRNSSDNTASYQDAQNNLALAEKAISAHWTVSGDGLSARDRGVVDAEFKAYLRDRINSYRSTMRNYEQNLGLAEVNVSLSSEAQPVGRQPRTRGNLTVETTEPTEVVVERIETRPSPYSATLLGPAAVMLALIAFLMFRQRGQEKPKVD